MVIQLQFYFTGQSHDWFENQIVYVAAEKFMLASLWHFNHPTWAIHITKHKIFLATTLAIWFPNQPSEWLTGKIKLKMSDQFDRNY